MKLSDELRKRVEYFRGIGGLIHFTREPHPQYVHWHYVSVELDGEIEFGSAATLEEAIADAIESLSEISKREF